MDGVIKKTKKTSDDDSIIKTALKRFKLAENAESDIRERGLEDMKFRAGDQWPENIRQSRAIEMKPCLTVNRMPTFIRQVTNDARQNRPQIKIDATDNNTVGTAEIMEGMVRHIQVASNADIAYDTACDNQVTMGFGYMRLVTDYCDDDSFDQDIKIKRIKNAFTVYFDPSCVEPDYSDAKWAFITADEDRDDFEKQNPNFNLELSSTGDTPPGWITEKTIRIAEYFEVVETEDNLYQLDNGQSFRQSKLPDGVKEQDGNLVDKEGNILSSIKNKRVSKNREVIWRKITATEVLEEKPWAGKYIPIIPVLGEDLDIDGKRDLIGMVRYARDPQRMYNYWLTAQTEAIALAPKAPFIIAEGQVEGYEKYWKQANTKNFSHLVYKPQTINGLQVPPPQRQTAEPPVQAMVQAIQQASADLKNTTGIHDASLGSQGNEVSGKAIIARQHEGDISNFHYIDNLSRAIHFLGVQLLDLIPKIYDAARVVRIVFPDGDSKTIKINQPSGEKDENGIEKIYDVTTGKYDVVVSVGPSFSTKRQEAASSMSQMVQSYPDLLKIGGDILVKSMDWPGADELAERFKKMLPPQLQDNPNQQQIPPQAKQQMDQAHQMIAALTKSLNEAHDKLDKGSDNNASKERIASMNIEKDILVELIKTESKASHAVLAAELSQVQERLKLLGIDQPIQNSVDTSQPNDTMQPSGPPAAGQQGI